MIAIIDYDAGNLCSVSRACDYVGARSEITKDLTVITRADRIIFPGVGRAGPAMRSLRLNKLDVVLKDAFSAGTPMLVICIGAQLILDRSEEDNTDCLGLIPGLARRFNPDNKSLKVPHMGWNQVQQVQSHPLLSHAVPTDAYYFANAYYPEPASEQHCYARSNHGGDFCAVLGKGSLFATQFHPEKSGPVGLRLLDAFLNWDGSPDAQ